MKLGLTDLDAVEKIMATLSGGLLRKVDAIVGEHKIMGYYIRDDQVRIDITMVKHKEVK